jgi:hypothetical protein
MSTLLEAGQFFPRHPEAGTPCIDIKLRGSGQHFWERRGLQPLSKSAGRVGHAHYSLIQGLLLVLFIPVTRHCVSGDIIGGLIGRGHNSAAARAYDLFVLQSLFNLLHTFPIAIDLAGALICRAVVRLYRPEPSRSRTCRRVAAPASLGPLPLALRAL